MTSGDEGAEKKKRDRSPQPRRNAASIEAYADEKMGQFMAIYGKLKYAAEIMRPLGSDIEIVPHTTNWDDWMKKIDERADEFVYKANQAKRDPKKYRRKGGAN